MVGKKAVPVETPEELEVATRVLAKSIARWAGNKNQIDTAIPGLRLSRWETPTAPTSYTLKSRMTTSRSLSRSLPRLPSGKYSSVCSRRIKGRASSKSWLQEVTAIRFRGQSTG
jgi:hypothetical protein